MTGVTGVTGSHLAFGVSFQEITMRLKHILVKFGYNLELWQFITIRITPSNL